MYSWLLKSWSPEQNRKMCVFFFSVFWVSRTSSSKPLPVKGMEKLPVDEIVPRLPTSMRDSRPAASQAHEIRTTHSLKKWKIHFFLSLRFFKKKLSRKKEIPDCLVSFFQKAERWSGLLSWASTVYVWLTAWKLMWGAAEGLARVWRQ